MTQMGKDLNGNGREVVVGSSWKQWLFSLIAHLPFFTRSFETAYLSSISEDQIPRTENGVAWTTTALILGALCSTPVTCWAADRYGRKVVAVGIGVLQVIPMILLCSEQNNITVIVSHAFIGISSSAMFVVVPVYVKETCHMQTRGVALALMMFYSAAGYLLMSCLLIVMGTEVLYVMAALGVAQFLLMFCLPETASFHVMKEKLETAKESLSKLKCLDLNSTSIIKEVDVLKAESDRAKSLGKLTLFQILKNQLWRDTTKIGLVMLTCYTLGGCYVFLDHWKVLLIAEIAVDVDTTNLVVPSVIVIGSLLCVIFICVCEQRYILTASFATMAVGLGVLGVFMQSAGTSIPWLPITALLLTIFGWSLAWGLPFVVLTEALNLEVRITLIGVVYIYSQVLQLLHVHTFRYIEEFVGIHALCYVFSGINMYGCVHALFGVPETRRKTVRNIEKQLKRIPPWEM